MANTEQAYSEILGVLKKHKDICVFDVDDLERKAKCHLFGVELKHKYGFDIEPKSITSLTNLKLDDHINICWFGEKYNRTVCWSDDGTQPNDELLLYISFPTGAYIFGEDYPTGLFQEFFLELKSFSPKYIDTTNNCLYYSMDNACKVYNEFKNIRAKYNEINKEDFKQRKIARMKKELEKLETK